MILKDILKELFELNGSDLHLVVGIPPVFRVNGDLIRAKCEENPLSDDDVWTMFEPYLTSDQKSAIQNKQDVLTSITLDTGIVTDWFGGSGSFRTCMFWDSNGLGASLRLIPTRIPGLSELCSPETEVIFRSLISRKRGLILITGPTGSGKSTTVASMIDTINTERSERIFTIERPVEYVHLSKMSLISQREVGLDVDSYEQGGISARRADPDVVLLGELLVPEAVRVALALADTGHLVFGTMTANSVSEAVRRLIESFPETRQTLQSMLARSLVAVISQQLVPRANGRGRVAAHEIMIANPRIRRMIEEGQTDLTVAIEAGRSESMCTMDDSLISLYRNGTISYENARARATDWKSIGPYLLQSNKATAPLVAPKNSLGESLVDKRVITEEQLNIAREVQMSAPGDLGNIVQDLGYASEKEVAKVRATVIGLQFTDLMATPPAADALKSVPDHIVKRYNIIPIKRHGNRLMVAVSNVKASMAGLDDVRLVSGCVIFPVLASRADIEDAIKLFYPASDISQNQDEFLEEQLD